MSEAQRVQGALMGEQGRLQQADVSGQQFVFGQRESRELQQLNRKQAQITGAQQQQAAANQAQAGYISSGISAVGNIGSSMIGMAGAPTAPVAAAAGMSPDIMANSQAALMNITPQAAPVTMPSAPIFRGNN